MENDNECGWADKPANRRRIRWLLYAVCALLIVAELLVDRHIAMSAERVPAFYAFYGFAALVGVVLAARLLRRFVERDGDYYDR